MKKIILYTGSYPYGKTTESFINPELQVMSQYKDYEITVVPVLKDKIIRDIPSKIILDNSIVNSSVFYRLKCFFSIFRKSILKELWKEKSEIKSIKYFYMAFKYLYATNLVYYDVKKKGNINQKIVFYGFWLSFVPIAFGLYKKKYPNSIHTFISRGHRCEVYTTDIGLYYPLRKFLFENIDKVYIVSDKGKEYLKNRYPFAANKIKRSYLGVNINTPMTKSANNENYIKLVSCSSVYPFKRVHLILESIYSFCSNNPDINIEWTHFGGGSLYKDLIEEANELKKDNLKIKLNGYTQNSDILKHYRENSYDIFIHLSESEGLPVSMMEAIASSIPILATNVGGVAELVTEQSGRILDVNFTQKEFDEALFYMIKNREQLKETTLLFFNKNFNAINNYPNFYNEIASL